MERGNIRQVKDLVLVDEVNELLEGGWVLLNTYTTAYDTEPPRVYYQTMHYVVGLPAQPDNPTA